MPIHRTRDPRKANTDFIQRVAYNLRASGLAFPAVTQAIKPRRFQSYDSPNGVLVAASLSDLPQHRANAARILGGPVRQVWADTVGTIWTRADA